MRRVRVLVALCAVCALLLVPTFVRADRAADEAAIRASAQGYAAAFTRKDAKGLAAFWAPDAVHAVEGKKVTGREAIEKAFTAMFKQAGDARLVVKINALRFVTDDVAIEDGSALVHRPGEATEQSTYTAVHVRKDGKWLLDSVRETEAPAAPTPFEHLKELDWMVGEWVDDSDDATVRTNVRWLGNGAFLIRSFSITIGDSVQLEGGQVIGWDPVKKQIRSLAFDSEGGFAEGIWSRDGNRWTVRAKTTLADGRQGTATNVFRYIDEDRFGWQCLAREIEGELMPNIDEVEVIRQAEEAETEAETETETEAEMEAEFAEEEATTDTVEATEE
jgi:uncharacterized protein (TIGR02246 family)